MKKFIKILLWVVGIVVCLLLVLSLLAGAIAKSYINKNGEELTGRRVSVEHVGVNLFSGGVNIRGLNVYEDQGDDVFAGFDTLDVRAALLQLPFKVVNLRHITLSGLHANIIQEGDRFNFSSLIEHFAPADTSAPKDTTPSDWTLKFYNIRLSHARVNYDDMLHHKGIHLPDINLRVPGFVLGGSEDTEGGLNLSFDRGGKLNIDANYDNHSDSYRLSVDLDDFMIENVDSYIADALIYDRLSGIVEAHLQASGRVDDIMKSRIGGTVYVKQLSLVGDKGPVAAFDSLGVKVANINLDNNSFDVESLTLTGLNAVYEQWKDYSNLSLLSRPSSAESLTLSSGLEEPSPEPAASTEPSVPLSFRLGSLRVENAVLTYTDHTLPDPFSFPLTAISISADNLSSSGDNNARLRATLPGGGQLGLRWNGNIDNWKQRQDLFLTVKGLDMKLLSPWAVAYTGQPIEDGIFGLTTKLNIRHSVLDNQNRIDIFKAKVGNRRKDVDPEVKVPLKTALYILKDKDDKILIDMPVSGNIDSPEFNYMKLVWKTLGNLLVKVATSPARALGNALGFGNDNLDFLPLDPSQHALTSEQYHILSDLATIAKSDTMLNISFLRQMPNQEADSTSSALARWDDVISQYMNEQGVNPSQISFSEGEAPTGKQPSGYAISSEITIEE